MILYFSGTGNSAYTAERIGRETKMEVLNLFKKIKTRDFSAIHSDSPWVIVTPTYAWRIPRLLNEWLTHTELTGSKKIYFVMTCGACVGNSEKYLKKLCQSRNLTYSGCFPIVMPENYIALFTTPSKEEALKIIHQAEATIDKAANLIKNKTAFPKLTLTVVDRLNSGIVNNMFYPVFVHAKKFSLSPACISCGKCAAVCPLNNIQMHTGKPAWGQNCTHCMACICRCPSEAIEYGTHSKGLPRYTCPK